MLPDKTCGASGCRLQIQLCRLQSKRAAVLDTKVHLLFPLALLRLLFCFLVLLFDRWDALLQVIRPCIVAVQCLTAHIDAFTSSQLAELSPECAKYVQTTLLQALEQTVPLQDPEQLKAQVHRHAFFAQG